MIDTTIFKKKSQWNITKIETFIVSIMLQNYNLKIKRFDLSQQSHCNSNYRKHNSYDPGAHRNFIRRPSQCFKMMMNWSR